MRTNRLALVILLMGAGAPSLLAQGQKVLTSQELFTRNVGTRAQQDTAFPPHKTEIDLVEATFTSVLSQQRAEAK